jgi:hypothetical protein
MIYDNARVGPSRVMAEPAAARVFNVMDLEREIEGEVRNTAFSRECRRGCRGERMAAQAIDKTARPAAHPEERPQPAPAYES